MGTPINPTAPGIYETAMIPRVLVYRAMQDIYIINSREDRSKSPTSTVGRTEANPQARTAVFSGTQGCRKAVSRLQIVGDGGRAGCCKNSVRNHACKSKSARHVRWVAELFGPQKYVKPQHWGSSLRVWAIMLRTFGSKA